MIQLLFHSKNSKMNLTQEFQNEHVAQGLVLQGGAGAYNDDI